MARFRGEKAVVSLLLLCLAAAPLAAQEDTQKQAPEPQEDTWAAGYLAGDRDAKGNGVWLLSGLFLGPVGLVLPWLFNPQAPGANLIGKSADYVAGYAEAYQRKVKRKNFFYSLGGFGILAGAVACVAGATLMGQSAECCGDAFNGGVFDPAFWTDTCCTSGL